MAKVSGFSEFIQARQEMIEKTNDPNLKKHYQADIDQARKSLDPGDIEDHKPQKHGGKKHCGKPKPEDGEGPLSGILKKLGIDGLFGSHKSDKTKDDAPNSIESKSGGGQVDNCHVGDFGNDNINKFAKQINEGANISKCDPKLLAAIGYQESRWDMGASTTNPGNGAQDTSAIQMNPNTFAGLQAKHPELQGKSLTDATTAIAAAGFLINDLKEKAKGMYPDADDKTLRDLALRGYNSGESTMTMENIHQGPGGTDPDYVKLINEHYDNIEKKQPLRP